MARETVIEVEELSIAYGEGAGRILVVREASLSIGRGQTLALVGESGSGKSTLARGMLRLLAGNGRVVGGRVRIGGADVSAMTERELREIRGATVGFVFQDPDSYLNPVFPIGRQVADVIALHRRVAPAQARALAEAQLAKVDIRDPHRVMAAYPHQLSGGMRQRVLIAMATSCRPALLIADEPTTALDVLVQRQVLMTIEHLKQENGMAVLLVTHDLGVVAEHADRVAVLYGGRIVEERATEAIFAAPRHPYTAGLIAAALPTSGHRFATLPGSPPDPRTIGGGCPFQPRCDRGLARCRDEMPPPARAADGMVACWNPQP